MLRNHNIVAFNLSRWDAPVISPGLMIARELAKYNKVMFIDHPFNFQDVIKQRKSPSVRKRMKHFIPFARGLEVLTNHSSSMHVLYPHPVLPINFLPPGKLYNFFSWVNHRIIARRIKKATRELDMKEIIFINSFNFHYPDAYKILDPKLNVYYCIDELVKPYSLRHGRANEDNITRKADLVINTSDALFNNRRKNNSNCFKVYNACDCQFFMQAASGSNGESKCLNDIARPIIGYYGCVERRIDFDMLYEVFAAHPEWSLVLVGPVEQQYIPERFKRLENVTLPGRKPYEEIPFILNQFDVALIPYKQDQVSQTIFPMKLYEYMSSGKPIVSLNFNPGLLSKMTNEIYLAESAETLAEAILAALGEKGEEKKNSRIALAKQNTWVKRAEEFSNILENELQLKGSGFN